MKKIIYGSLFLLLIGTNLISCDKKINSSLKDQNSTNIKSDDIRYTEENGVLVFNSVEDYETSISNLDEDEEANLVSSLNSLNYTSYTEELANIGENATDLIGDNVLSAILNKDRVVQIANFLYKVNIQTEKVYVLPIERIENYSDLISENTENKYIRQFSTGDDVIYSAENGDPGEKCGGIGDGTYPCYSSNAHGLIVNTTPNGNVWRLNPGVKFFKAGVYFKLSSLYEIWAFNDENSTTGGTKIKNLNGIFTVRMYCKGPEGWYKKRPCNSGSIGTRNYGLFWTSINGQDQRTFYSGSRNLNGYYFFVQAEVMYPNGGLSPATPYGGRNINSPY